MAKRNIRIPITVNKPENVTISLEQDFDTLDVLSLRITSDDVYQKATSNFGVVVGRVSINGGFGVKNAKVSIFVPITTVDKSRSEILEIYPFETINDTFPNGVRYNLLPRLKQNNPDHVPAGTFPDVTDLTHHPIYLEVLEKYYKYTTTTNEYGDYMIFGVPIGVQNILMDFDLLDTPSLSVSVNDLIYGLPFGKDLIKSVPDKIEPDRIPGFTYYGGQTYTLNQNTDLNAMPNIFSEQKNINVIPFWGDNTKTTLGITRCDFSINYSYTPSAVFFGTILSSDIGKGAITKDYAIGKTTFDDLSPLKNLKVVIWYISNGEQKYYGTFDALAKKETYTADPDMLGVFRINLPMYSDYFKMNEFGEIVESTDGTGIPTKGQYLFEFYDNDEVWCGRVANDDYKRSLLPGVRIPGNDNGITALGGWDVTNPITFEYDIQKAKRKYYTIATTYSPTNQSNVLMSGNYLPYLPNQTALSSSGMTQSGFPLKSNVAYAYNDNRTVIGSVYIPRVEMIPTITTIDNSANAKLESTNHTVSIKIADKAIVYLKSNETQTTQIVQPQEWLIGLNTKANGGRYASVKPMVDYYGVVYNYTYTENGNLTWNYGPNSLGDIKTYSYYNTIAKKVLENEQMNSDGVFNMFTSGVIDFTVDNVKYSATTGPFINETTNLGGLGLFTTEVYDVTDELPELLKDQLNTSMKVSSNGLYNNKCYYFGKTYNTSSLKSIGDIYNG